MNLSRPEQRLIQIGLLAEGFELGKTDGLIGARTRAALRRWQAARSETVTGYLDVESAKALVAAGEQESRRQAATEAERLRREEEARQPVQREAQERAHREREAQEVARREEEQLQKWERLGLVMARVEGGSFTMGCQSLRDGMCFKNEKPAHRVHVASFEIGKNEVTQELWEMVMGDNPSRFGGCDRCPVEKVNWDDVQAFLRGLNDLTGKRYRLPTEAEWEYAARGGRKSQGYQYAGGDSARLVAWYKANSGSRTHPVGGKRANELDLHDMSGNVWEWVQDCWNDSHQGAPADGRSRAEGTCNSRVVRGGSWSVEPGHLRTASRSGNSAGNRYINLGFRIARTLTP